MPDESCRNCGGILIEYTKCAQCNKTIQLICSSCGARTIEQFHSLCVFGKYYGNYHVDENSKNSSILATVA